MGVNVLLVSEFGYFTDIKFCICVPANPLQWSILIIATKNLMGGMD